MASGAATVGLVKVAAMLVGMVAIWRSNRAKKRGEAQPEDEYLANRIAQRAETDRRMASYLAQRRSASQTENHEMTEQEIRR
jgi:Na+/glutamate symporter